MNKVQLIGRLGKDAESHEHDDKLVTDFQIATEENWKNEKGEKQSKTEWHSCTIWGNKNLVKYLTKGTHLYVEGKLAHSSYDNEKGDKVFTTKVVVDEVELLGSPSKT